MDLNGNVLLPRFNCITSYTARCIEQIELHVSNKTAIKNTIFNQENECDELMVRPNQLRLIKHNVDELLANLLIKLIFMRFC